MERNCVIAYRHHTSLTGDVAATVLLLAALVIAALFPPLLCPAVGLWGVAVLAMPRK